MLEYETSKAYDKASLGAEISTKKRDLEDAIEFYSPWYSGVKLSSYPMQEGRLGKLKAN